MTEATSVVDWVTAHTVTIVFVTLYATAFITVLKLHLSNGKNENFDLTDLIKTHDGRADGEKIKVYLVFLAGYFAFFFLLYHDGAKFVTYGPWFIGLFIVHQLGNRMTDKSPVTPPKTDG